MTLLDLASSPWWYVVSIVSLLAIYVDWSKPTNRRMVIAFAIAFCLGTGVVFAAEVPYDVCKNQCPFADWAMWWLLNCFLC